MANFLRQKYKEKPKIWGSFESVQRSLFKNAERIGINPYSIVIAIPFWENASRYINDYANNIKMNMPISSAVFVEKNKLKSTSAVITNASLSGGNTNQYETTNTKLLCIVRASHTGSVTDREYSIFRKDNSAAATRAVALTFINNKLRCLINTNSTDSWAIGHDRNIINISNINSYALSWDGSKQYEYQNTTLLGDVVVSGNIVQDNSAIVSINGIYWTQSTAYTLNGSIDTILYATSYASKEIIYSLSDNPYQLWQRQPDFYFSIPVIAGGTTYQATCATSWFIRVVSEKQTAWNILNLLSKGSDWKIFKDAALNSSYKILSDTTQESSFKILSDTIQESSYKILHRSVQDSTYMILSDTTQESAWQILLSSLTEQSLAWKILNSEERETSWQITLSNILEQALSWKISNTEIKNSAFNILNDSSAISAWKINICNDHGSTWKILNEKTIDSTWKIKNDNIIDTTWQILNVNDTDLAYSIKHLLENNSEWKVFNTETINSSWSLLSDIIPSALYEFIQSQRTTEFSQTERTFLFNQAQRTFIFLK